MVKLDTKALLTFDDVLLVPQYSEISSRLDVDLSAILGKSTIDYPIISAPMDTVTNGQMAHKMGSLGGLGIVHRFQSVKERIAQVGQLKTKAGVAIGLKDTPEEIKELSKWYQYLCIDVAHGDCKAVVDMAKAVREMNLDSSLIVGNIATAGAVRRLAPYCNVLRVGIGPGSVCSTRIVTGFGIPQLSAIMNVNNALETYQEENPKAPYVYLIADGGMKNSGDVAKALAAGADAVMMGSYFAGTDEAPGEVIERDGKKYKFFRGMASRFAQEDYRGGLKEGTVAEGVNTEVPYKGSVETLFDDLVGGLRSAFTYAGAKNLGEFQLNTTFVRITQNGMNESVPHILKGR